MDNFGCVNSSLSLFYFCFVTNLQKKFMTYVRLQLNLSPLHLTSWKYFTLWKFSLDFVRILRTNWIFELNFAALIQVSIDAFWHSFVWNLNHVRMRKLQLFITRYDWQVSWHDMNFKLTLGYLLTNEVGQWSNQLDRVTFSKNVFWSVKYNFL